MKKLLILVTAVCLVFSLGAIATAEEKSKTVYVEYEKEKDADNYGPTLGLDWGLTDQWTLSLSYQLEGDGGNEATTSLGAEYAILENLAAILTYETADSEDSIALELSGSYALSDPWALTGGVVYTAYTPDEGPGENLKYNELELAAGVEYQATEALLTSLQYVWTDTSFDDDVLDATTGDSADKFVVGAEYSLGDYAVYLEYEIPDEGYTATLGVAYKF
jgi:predicted porin